MVIDSQARVQEERNLFSMIASKLKNSDGALLRNFNILGRISSVEQKRTSKKVCALNVSAKLLKSGEEIIISISGSKEVSMTYKIEVRVEKDYYDYRTVRPQGDLISKYDLMISTIDLLVSMAAGGHKDKKKISLIKRALDFIRH